MRAGNVIGGGDFAADRIVPDCYRAAVQNKDIVVRNPHSIRPFQHVLEPVMAYLMVAKEQFEQKNAAGSYNVGPETSDCIETAQLVETFCSLWNKNSENALRWYCQSDGGPHEANFLKLDCSKLKSVFGWKPVWDVREALEKTVEVYQAYNRNENTVDYIQNQIAAYRRKELE
jgi:CDP-glucose 4,6-dehydratase